ncbi:MAG TPA: DUF4097 family beta strand repeat-containing protein [Acidimicrobiia bacterium]|nr:DUF4097 family beta strand repeat-containing protein [Acidimicrobiia bacterium]
MIRLPLRWPADPPSPLPTGGRRGLFAAGLVLTVMAVAFTGLVLVNRMARQTVSEKHVYDFTGSTLSIDLALGDVQIVPGDSGEITVSRRLTYGLRRPAVEERIDGDTFRVTDRNCTADTLFPCQVKWLLQIPRDLFVEVRTVEGSIRTSGLSGTVKLTSESGDVSAVTPSGPLVTLRSRTGDVSAINVNSPQVVATSDTSPVQLTFRTAPSLVVGRSQRGPVGVLLPDSDDTYKITVSSQEGSKTVTAHNDDNAKRKVDIRSVTGDVSVLQSPES